MKVLDAGTETMSNVDALKWMQKKREQYAKEDAEEKANGRKPTPRPKAFMKALERHERELKNPVKYPYKRNPSAYLKVDDGETLRKFDDLMCAKVIDPLSEPYRERCENKEMTLEELDKTLGKEQDSKCLSEMELLMIHNHAPQCVEMLQPMLENAEERFTAEEQQLIVDAIMEVYRNEETAGETGEEAAG